MSTELLWLSDSDSERKDRKIYFTAFFGGIKRGKCLQISIHDKYISLTKNQVKDIIKTLKDFLKGDINENTSKSR